MAEKKRQVLPWIIFILLFCCVFACGWLIWRQYARLYEEVARDEAAAAVLRGQKDELQQLLKRDPCEVPEIYFHKTPTKPPESASPSSSGQIVGPQKRAAALDPDIKSAPLNTDQIEAACVFLISLQSPHSISTGSGFFISPDYVLTNKHVIGGQNKIFVTSKALGKPAIGRVVAQSAGSGDYALLKVDLPANAGATYLKLAPNVRKTEKVGAWGFPDLVGKTDPQYSRLIKGADFSAVPELSYSEGVVSAVLDRKPKIIVHTAPISPGNSGGPLLNAKGEVVGINTMISLDEDSYRQASIALAASELKNFLRENGVR